MTVDDVAANRQAQPRTLAPALLAPIDLAKLVEDALLVAIRDARATIRDVQCHEVSVSLRLLSDAGHFLWVVYGQADAAAPR